MSEQRLKFQDSEGVPVAMFKDDQGDIYLEVGGACLIPRVKNCARFCAGNADGGYAPNTKRALRALWDAMVEDGAIVEGKTPLKPLPEGVVTSVISGMGETTRMYKELCRRPARLTM